MPAFSLERLRRLLHSPGNAPLAHSCFGLTPRGEAFDILHRTRAFRPFCLLRLPSLLWFAFGGYPTRPEICHRHISFSGSPHTVGNHPLRGRWPEGPDEVAPKESCPNPAHSSVAYGDSLFFGAPSAFTALARECAAGAFLFRAHSPRGSLRQSAPHHPKLHPCAQKGRLIRQTAIHLLKSKSICIAADFVLW